MPCHILFQCLDLFSFHLENFFVNIGKCQSVFFPEKTICDRLQQFLDITDRQKSLEIIDKDKHQKMLLGIFLFHRRRQKIVLCIIIDHCLRQYLIRFLPCRTFQPMIHKSSNLIHVKIDIRDICRFDIIYAVKAFHYAV